MPAVYSVALITRGAGAYAYSYSGPAGLVPGAVVAVPFQQRLELGLVMGPDSDPPTKLLLSLVPVEIERWPDWGKRLLKLCELSVSAPDELAGHLLFDGARKSLRLRLELNGSSAAVQALAPLAGKLTPALQKQLARQWDTLAAAHSKAESRLVVSIAGDPDATRGDARWSKHFELSASDATLLGLPQRGSWRGSYLAGFDGLDLRQIAPMKAPPEAPSNRAEITTLEFRPTELPADWELVQHWHKLTRLTLRSCTCSWPELRAADGLAAILGQVISSVQRALVITPQTWMVERLWPVLAPLAEHIARFRAEAGPGTASQILRQLEAGSHVVVGGPGAWKLAAYFAFDRILLLDPTHPQYAPERTPHLDPRLSVLLCAAQHPQVQVDLVNFGLDALSHSSVSHAILLHEPFDPDSVPTANPAVFGREDTDPLPLELRRPDKRRLIYFNRLGSGRGLFCAECWTAVHCPRCGSARIHYAPAQSAYACPDCSYADRDLRCPSCHLMTLVAVLPGLESVTRRPGDVILHGPLTADRTPTHIESVIGTSQLLDPLPGFWAQQIIYVHAEGRVGLLADWPGAADMALRLAALYENPELETLHIVSGRLAEQLGPRIDADVFKQHYTSELELRALAGLPPFGTLYHFHAISARSSALTEARQHLGERLHSLPATTLLRLGTSYRQGGAHRLGGWLLNPEVTLRELQELRWELHRLDVALTIHALRGPWVW